MGKARNRIKITLGREVFDVLLIVLTLVLVLDVVVSLVFLSSNQEGYLGVRKEGFRMAACWVLLIAICLACDHLRNWRSIVLLLSVALGAGIQATLLASVRAQGAQYTNFELATSVFAVYFTLPMFMVLLVSTKVDNLHSEMEKERFRVGKLGSEAGRLVELLKKSKETREDTSDDDDETSLARRKLILETAADIYTRLMSLRARKDAAALLEEVFNEKFGFDQGFVLEAADEGREMKLKGVWGFQMELEAAEKLIDEWKDRELTAWALDRREFLDQERMRKLPKLAEAHERFSAQLFGLQHVLPVVSQNRASHVVYLGEQAPDAPLHFDYSLVEPFMQGLGLILAKLGKTGQTKSGKVK